MAIPKSIRLEFVTPERAIAHEDVDEVELPGEEGFFAVLPGHAPLPRGKFISAVIRAKSGLPVRSGIARLAAWSWMFKAYTLRDWAIFTQTFGQPVRVDY